MSDSKKISILVVVILVLGFVVFKASRPSHHQDTDQQVLDSVTTQAQAPEASGAAVPVAVKSEQTTADSVPPTVPTVSQQAALLQQTPLSAKEIKSVKSLTGVMVRLLSKRASASEVSKAVSAAGLTPVKTVDANPYTGRMTTIRTKNALDGTRYLHIQLVGNTEKDEGLQHVSFQIRPGRDSQEQAKKIVKQMFPKAKVTGDTDGVLVMDAGNGMEARVEIMNTTDQLAAIPANAYSKDDVGSVNVVIEQDPHYGSGDEHDH